MLNHVATRHLTIRRRLALWGAAFACIFLGLMAGSASVRAAPDDFDILLHARLSGAEEAAPNESIATGYAVFALSEGNGITRTVHYRLTVADIVTVTGAHIHVGLPGVDGPVVVDLLNGEPLAPDIPVSGEFSLSEADALVLTAGGMYVNVHTDAFPGGEIRGQVEELAVPSARHALLLGEHERPTPVETDARGVATFAIDPSGVMTYSVVITDLVNFTVAHIHRGTVEEAGPVVYPLDVLEEPEVPLDVSIFVPTLSNGSNGESEASDEPEEPGDPQEPEEPEEPEESEHPHDPYDPYLQVAAADNLVLQGVIQLGTQDMVDLMTGYFYVNVHTTQHPAGEIRGQITHASLFQADLTGAEETHEVDTQATGRAVLGLDASGSNLHYRVLVDDIENITAAHIHLGERGVAGGVTHNLFPSGEFSPSQPLSGVVPVTDHEMFDLLAGRYYINVHTTEYPAGEIRGQIEAYAPHEYHHAILSGDEEVPPVDTDATGLARFRMDAATGLLHYTVFGREIENVTMAHIHLAPRGQNGGVVFDFDAEGFGEGAPLGGAFALDAANLVDLLTGFYYVNVHTAMHGGGEIRGQIGGPRTFAAELLGEHEVPSVTTTATGRALVALSADATELVYHIAVEDITDITAAHIHRGPRDDNGPVVVNFMPPASFGPGSPISGTVPITFGLALELAGEALYVNVHTDDYPNGEIRGQLEPLTLEQRWTIPLEGAQEVPPIPSGGSGEARFFLDPQLSMARYELWVEGLPNVTGAHIHLGERGVNGPVVYNLLAGGRTLSNTVPASGGVHLDAQSWVNWLAERFYVNVHTTAYLGGEIRGQIE